MPAGQKELFLNRHLLLDFAPGANLQAAAHPTERLAPNTGGIGAADRTFCHLGQDVGRNGPLRLFQHLRWNYGFGLQVDLSFHCGPQYSFTMAESERGYNPLT